MEWNVRGKFRAKHIDQLCTFLPMLKQLFDRKLIFFL